MKQNKLMRFISSFLIPVVFFTFINIQKASADELSDANAALQAAKTTYTNSQTTLSNARVLLDSKITALSNTDSTTVTAETYAAMQSDVSSARTAASAAENAFNAATTALNVAQKKVTDLEAAISLANNCPSTWGLDSSTFADGIDLGTYIFNNKILSEIGKDQRNIVINTTIEFSKDNGSTWSSLSTLNFNTWNNVAANYKYYQKTQTIQFLGGGSQLLRYTGAQIRAVTILEKQNCSTLTFKPASKSLTIAAPQYSQTSLTDLYNQFPQAFTNFQVRDYFINLVKTIKTDYATKVGAGSTYYLGNGYYNGSEIAIYPKTGSCTGDLNQVFVQSNSTCEIGIYWVYGNTIKLVDVATATGGLTELQKQAEALKPLIATLLTNATTYFTKATALQNTLVTTKSKYLNADASQAQAGVQELNIIYNSAVTLSSDISFTYQQAVSYQKTKLIGSEQMSQIQSVVDMRSKSLAVLGGIFDESQSLIDQLNQIVATSSSDVKNELNNSVSFASQSKQYLSSAQSYFSQVAYKGPYDQSTLDKYINEAFLYRDKISNSTNYSLQRMKVAESQMNSVTNQTLIGYWKNIYSNYQSANNYVSQAVGIYNDLITKLKSMVPSTATLSNAKDDLNNANTSLASIASQINLVTKYLSDLKSYVKSKNLTTAATYADEVKYNQAMADKFTVVSKDFSANAASAESARSKATSTDEINVWSASRDTWGKGGNIAASISSTHLKLNAALVEYQVKIGITPLVTTDSGIVDLSGEDEDVSGTVASKKETSGKYLITVKTNQSNYDVTVKAVKSKAKAIVFNITTNDDGDIIFRTTRKLTGYTLQLWVDGTLVNSTKKLA